ncbi:MAG TPA: hypothetical protein VGB64_12475 [Actinomycetota bacterium]
MKLRTTILLALSVGAGACGQPGYDPEVTIAGSASPEKETAAEPCRSSGSAGERVHDDRGLAPATRLAAPPSDADPFLTAGEVMEKVAALGMTQPNAECTQVLFGLFENERAQIGPRLAWAVLYRMYGTQVDGTKQGYILGGVAPTSGPPTPIWHEAAVVIDSTTGELIQMLEYPI